MEWLANFLGLNKGKATVDAADQNRNVINNYGTQGGQIIDEGAAGAQGYLKEILGLSGYTPGEGGEYQQSPGYQFQMDQGQQALDRRAAASGRFASGNADLDTLKFSQGLANQDYNGWLDRVTGGLGNLAGLETDTAGAKLGLKGEVASGLTSVNNMKASGKEAGQGGFWDILGNVAGTVGAFTGAGSGGAPKSNQYSPGFGGYGSF